MSAFNTDYLIFKWMKIKYNILYLCNLYGLTFNFYL
jgi:hypothetical protein